MNPISEQDFRKFLEKNEISLAAVELNIGKQLSSPKLDKRIVIIHLLNNDLDEYIASILRLLLRLEREWFVFPRYGTIENVMQESSYADIYAANINANEIEELIEAIISIQRNQKVIESDPYMLADSGEILASWDHHIFLDGFCVSFSNIKKSTMFVGSLNELGVELDVIYSNG
jgi:hypothetical protein